MLSEGRLENCRLPKSLARSRFWRAKFCAEPRPKRRSLFGSARMFHGERCHKRLCNQRRESANCAAKISPQRRAAGQRCGQEIVATQRTKTRTRSPSTRAVRRARAARHRAAGDGAGHDRSVRDSRRSKSISMMYGTTGLAWINSCALTHELPTACVGTPRPGRRGSGAWR